MEEDRVLLRSGLLLLQSLNDEHDWAYRYFVLRRRTAASLPIFESAAKTPVRTVALGTDAASRPFDAAEAQRLRQRRHRAQGQRPHGTFDASAGRAGGYDWRRALQANLPSTIRIKKGPATRWRGSRGGHARLGDRGGRKMCAGRKILSSAPAAAAAAAPRLRADGRRQMARPRPRAFSRPPRLRGSCGSAFAAAGVRGRAGDGRRFACRATACSTTGRRGLAILGPLCARRPGPPPPGRPRRPPRPRRGRGRTRAARPWRPRWPAPRRDAGVAEPARPSRWARGASSAQVRSRQTVPRQQTRAGGVQELVAGAWRPAVVVVHGHRRRRPRGSGRGQAQDDADAVVAEVDVDVRGRGSCGAAARTTPCHRL